MTHAVESVSAVYAVCTLLGLDAGSILPSACCGLRGLPAGQAVTSATDML